MMVQPDLKLGLFTAMSTGGAREGPFFSDSLVEFSLRIVPQFLPLLEPHQPSVLPPSPEDYTGNYSGLFGDAGLGGLVSTSGVTTGVVARVEVGMDPSGPYGSAALYILSNNLGLSVPQPLAWVRGDTFVMTPLPTAACWSIEGGEEWPIHFSRGMARDMTRGSSSGAGASGRAAITSLTVDGFMSYPGRLDRIPP